MATGTLAVGLRNMAKALFWCMISSMRTCIAVWRHFNDALLTGLLITTRTPHHRSRLRATESMSRADAANCPLPHAPSGRRNLFLTWSSRVGGPNAATHIPPWSVTEFAYMLGYGENTHARVETVKKCLVKASSGELHWAHLQLSLDHLNTSRKYSLFSVEFTNYPQSHPASLFKATYVTNLRC